jgi:hypothetical protein
LISGIFELLSVLSIENIVVSGSFEVILPLDVLR